MTTIREGARRRRDPLPGRGRALAALALAAPLILASCDDATLMSPDPEAGDVFARYVALGNSITAGFQSDGINDSTQTRSYAAFLAEGMGTRFEVPELRAPGCPPPLVNVFEGTRVGGGAGSGLGACSGSGLPRRSSGTTGPIRSMSSRCSACSCSCRSRC